MNRIDSVETLVYAYIHVGRVLQYGVLRDSMRHVLHRNTVVTNHVLHIRDDSGLFVL